MTWGELIELEPKLEALRKQIQLVDDSKPNVCATEIWLKHFKPRMVQLVGWERIEGPAVLKTEEAYRLAYHVLFHQTMPDCKHKDFICPG